MIAVCSGDISRVRDDAIGVGQIVAVNITAQHGEVGNPIALLAAGFCSGKAAVEGHAALERKSGGAVTIHVTTALVGIVQPFCYPDLAGFAYLQRVLQRHQRIGPGLPGLRAGSVLIHVQHATHRAGEGLVFVGAHVHEHAHKARGAGQVGEDAGG